MGNNKVKSGSKKMFVWFVAERSVAERSVLSYLVQFLCVPRCFFHIFLKYAVSDSTFYVWFAFKFGGWFNGFS